MNVLGYELLYRSGNATHANVVDHDHATSQVIINSFLEIGLDNLVGSRQAFINMPESFLAGRNPIPFASDRVVLEVLEHIRIDGDMLRGLTELRAQGYMLALDDFELTPQTRPLLQLASIVKLDVMGVDPKLVRSRADMLRPFGVKLLAEKIETQEMLEECKKAGFDYFQGYFLSRPNIVKGAQMPANRLALLQLLARLNDPNIETPELEKIVERDVGLSYKLLRVINSAAVGMRSKVESVRHAMVMLGHKSIKHWATVISLAAVDDKPYELVVVSLQRARFCQLLAQQLKSSNVEAYFTAGLFSTLEAMLDKPYSELLPQLSLSDEINAALTGRAGTMGAVLDACISFERGDWKDAGLAGSSVHDLQRRYLDAIQWASEIATQMMASPADQAKPEKRR